MACFRRNISLFRSMEHDFDSHFDLLDASFPESGWGHSVNNQFEEPGGPQSANALRIFSVNSCGLRTCERHQSLRPCDVDVWPLFERSDMGLDEG